MNNKNTESILYLDMDGVLVDFDKGYAKIASGKTLKSVALESGETVARNTFLQAGASFWANLDWIQGGPELIKTAQKHFSNVWILSSAGTIKPELGKTVIQGKLEWLKKNVPSIPTSNVLIVYGKHRKKEYAAKNAILVDDMPDTIESWQNKGGNGILHSHHYYKKTIASLEDLTLSPQYL